jgi:hypothetical protein
MEEGNGRKTGKIPLDGKKNKNSHKTGEKNPHLFYLSLNANF